MSVIDTLYVVKYETNDSRIYTNHKLALKKHLIPFISDIKTILNSNEDSESENEPLSSNESSESNEQISDDDSDESHMNDSSCLEIYKFDDAEQEFILTSCYDEEDFQKLIEEIEDPEEFLSKLEDFFNNSEDEIPHELVEVYSF